MQSILTTVLKATGMVDVMITAPEGVVKVTVCIVLPLARGGKVCGKGFPFADGGYKKLELNFLRRVSGYVSTPEPLSTVG